MRIAIPVWNGRVSPVFDVATSIRVFDIHHGTVIGMSNSRLESDGRAAALVKLGVDLLICAAISVPLESALWISGVEVIPDTCGTAEDIIAAFVAGDTALEKFRSPGHPCNQRPTRETASHPRLGTENRILARGLDAWPGNSSLDLKPDVKEE
jgi:predicted Fe-Mo cluster-binding NifX family protein